MSNIPQLKNALSGDNLKKRFNEVLGAKSTQFIASILTSVSNNNLLSKCDPKSIINSAMVAATLDLPINPNLGFAYIIPYGNQAQFQIGYKGFIQLAQRSGKFKGLNVSAVKEGEIANMDFLTGGFDFNWIQNSEERIKAKTIGFVAYFELLNGFSKMLYMSIEEIESHAKKFSKSYQYKTSVWKTNFDSMASKTVMKMLLSKYAPLSTAMEKAVVTDQAVINNEDATDISYIDNDSTVEEAEVVEDIATLIDTSESKENLLKIWSSLSEEQQATYTTQFTIKLKTFA